MFAIEAIYLWSDRRGLKDLLNKKSTIDMRLVVVGEISPLTAPIARV